MPARVKKGEWDGRGKVGQVGKVKVRNAISSSCTKQAAAVYLNLA